FQDHNLASERLRRGQHLARQILANWRVCRGGKVADRRRLGSQFEQQTELLAHQLGIEQIHSRFTLLLGRLKLLTMLYFTGAMPIKKTIGIVEVAAFAARTAVGEPVVTITAACRRTRSAASSGKSECLRYAERNSNVTF